MNEDDVYSYLTDMSQVMKFKVDLFKLIITLSSGSIVVISSLATQEGFVFGFLTSSALLLFAITIMLSLMNCFIHFGYVSEMTEMAHGHGSKREITKLENLIKKVGPLPVVCFFLSMLLLVLSVVCR